MPTEFTKHNHEIVTPFMKSIGFKKVGRYCYGATCDQAKYVSGKRTITVYYSIHPYDHPIHGVRVEIRQGQRKLDNKHYGFGKSGIRSALQMFVNDLEKNRLKLGRDF